MIYGRSSRHKRQTPDDGDNNGWYRILPPPTEARRLDGHHHFEWVVIGAGISGLSTARELALRFPGTRIALVEAQRVGFGPSGRNAGFIVNHHLHAPLKNPRAMATKIKLATAGVDYLRNWVRDYQVRCDWSDAGRIYACTDAAGADQLDGMERLYDQFHLERSPRTREQLAAITGSDRYLRGFHVPGSALVNPAAMLRGLAGTLPSNVELFELSPVHNVESGPPHRVEFAEGSIACENLVVAANTFSLELGFAKNIVPVAIYASLTDPLDEADLERLRVVGEFGVMEVLDSGATVRLTRDRRIFLRGGIYSYAKRRAADVNVLREAEALHTREIARRFPQLRRVRIAYTWSGVIGFSRNDAHVFGRLGRGLYANVPMDSSPVSRGAFAGKLLADEIAGEDSDLLREQRSLAAPAWLPPEPILGWATRRKLRAAMAS